jgi:hypothetical protein
VSARRRLTLAAAAGLLVVAVVLFLVLRHGEGDPALDASTSYDELSTHKSGGETLANALVYLHNRSGKPITLQGASVKTTGKAPREFRFLVAGPGRTDDVQGGVEEQCPPSFFTAQSIKPVSGFRLEPDATAAGRQGAVLITCFTVPDAPSRFRFTEMTVTYLQDGKRRTATFPNHFAVCSAPGGKCDPDEGGL